MLKRHDLAIVEIVRQFDAGDLEPGEVIVGNVVNGVMSLVTPGNMSEPVIEAVEEARQALIDEAILVPELPDRPPIEAVGTDYSIRIELAPSGCVVEDFEPVVGDVVRFDIENRFSEESGIGLWKIFDDVTLESITFEGLNSGEQSPDGFWKTSTDVLGGGRNALTVRFDEPGKWVIVCFSADDTTEPDRRLVTVVEPTPNTEAAIDVEGDPSLPTCAADIPDLQVGDAVAFDVDNDASVPVGVGFWEVKAGTTSLPPGWLFQSGARPLRRIVAFPGDTGSGVVRFDQPGTYTALCFVMQPPFDDLNTIVFDVASAP
jgi:hypothetical protein